MHKMLSAVVICALTLLAHAAQASAGVELFIGDGQGLSAGNARSSTTGTTGIDIVYGSANHTWCPALAQGYSGYTSTPNSDTHFTAHAPSCGPYDQYWYPNGTSDIWFRGAALNPNQTTFDVFSWARYQW